MIERKEYSEHKKFNVLSFALSLALLMASLPNVTALNLASGAIYPQISGDGEQIVFSYQGAIWKMPRMGGEMTRLTNEPGFDIEPAWSPDGQKIAFIRSSNFGSGQLQIISADGEHQQLPTNVSIQDRLFFDTNGNRLLGRFADETRNFALRWLNIRSGKFEPALLTDIRRLRYALSQDGSQIAIAESRDKSMGLKPKLPEQAGNNGPQFSISILPSDGGEPAHLVEFPDRIYDLAWANNDQALYIVTNAGGAHNDLWYIPLDNPQVGARKVSFGQADEDRPTLSQDSRWMVYSDNHSGPTQLMLRDLHTQRDQPMIGETRDYSQGTGRLRLTIQEEDTGVPSTARISVVREGGKYHTPPDKLYRIQGTDMHFYASGESSLTLPAGNYRITAWRGPEYTVTRQTVVVAQDQTKQVTLSLSRWTDQKSQGWFSGESHIHANYGYGHWYNSPRTMLAQCAGEDLLVCNLVVANSDSDGVYDREFFRGAADPLSTSSTRLHWNQEFRSTIWGHLTLLNLQQLVEPIFTGFAHTTHPHDHPTNADVGMLVHDQDGHVNYTHPAQNLNDPYLTAYSAKALPIDIALGTVDSIDVMGSNHNANMRLWYGLLNCGFKIPASAGTDCFLNRIRSRLPGSVRFYVNLEEPYSDEAWMKGFKAGRTFATNGPMFEFMAGGKSLGETVELKAPGMISVTGEVRSQFPLSQAEIVFNGQVIDTVKATGANSTRITIAQTISIPTSGWIALRARGPRHPDAGSSLFGHTSPVYIQIEGHPQDARQDATYFVNWIDRLWKDVQARDRIPSRHFKHVKSQIENAREVYEQLSTAITK